MARRIGLVVIDPQRGFTDRRGSYAKTHGFAELTPIVETARRLGTFATRHSGPSIWVRSLYRPGQFVAREHPLAELCTSLDGLDCEWDPHLVPPPEAVIVTKHEPDATSSPDYAPALDELMATTDVILITGFTLPTCVAATAISSKKVGTRTRRIVVPLTLSAARAGNYRVDDAGPSLVETTIARLRQADIAVPQSHHEIETC